MKFIKKLFGIKQKPEKPEKPIHFSMKGNISANIFTIADKTVFKGENILNFNDASSGNTVHIGHNFYANNLKVVFKGHNNQLIIGDNVKWTGHILIVGQNRTVKIGHNTTAQDVYILGRDADVIIGNNCMLSHEIEIRGSDVHKVYDRDTNIQQNIPKPVFIDDNVWIAARAFISKGASIPKGSIVSACAFVNKIFTEQNSVIAGIPAKIIKRNIRWER